MGEMAVSEYSRATRGARVASAAIERKARREMNPDGICQPFPDPGYFDKYTRPTYSPIIDKSVTWATIRRQQASPYLMIRRLKSGQFRLYSRKKNAETGKRRNLGTFATLEQAKQHEREVQYFKRH
jgi:hypothetical protein